MDLQTFISILRSRLEDLALEKAYIEKKCSETEKHLFSMSDDDRAVSITELYLESIIDSARQEAERLRQEDLLLEESVASILSGPRNYSLLDTDPDNDSYISTTRKGPVLSHEKQNTSGVFATQNIPNEKSKNDAKAKIPLQNTIAFGNTVSNISSTRISNENSSTRIDSETEALHPKSPYKKQKNDNRTIINKTVQIGAPETKEDSEEKKRTYSSKKIKEKDLYNSSPNLIFTLLLIFFSPTILLSLALFAVAVLAILSVFSTIMIIILLASSLVFIIGGALCVLTISYSVSSVLVGNISSAIIEAGVFLVVFSLTMLLSSLITRLARKILPGLSHSIVKFCSFALTAPKSFFAKCKRGCATL